MLCWKPKRFNGRIGGGVVSDVFTPPFSGRAHAGNVLRGECITGTSAGKESNPSRFAFLVR